MIKMPNLSDCFNNVPKRRRVLSGFLIALLLMLASCGQRNQSAQKLAQDTSVAQEAQSQLILKDATLEQVDEKGQLLWRVKTQEAKYDPDRETATVMNPKGELFQDGKLVFRVEAKQGEVHQDGKTVFLRGDIIATDVRDGVVLKGKEMEWRPQEDLLVVRDRLVGTHPRLEATAKEARAFSRQRRIELLGTVVARSKDPELKMVTEKLLWKVAENQVIGQAPIKIDRFEEKKITASALAGASEVNIETKIATLGSSAQITFTEPEMQVNSQVLTWKVKDDLIEAPKLVNVIHRQQQVNVTGNQGQVDLTKQVIYLVGNVRGKGERNQSILGSDRLLWNLPTQEMQAEGNVTYKQADPPLDLRGERAVGKLQDQTVVVTGGETKRVEIQIKP